MLRKLLSLLFWAYIAFSCATLFVGAVVIWLFTFWWDKRRRWLHQYSCAWGYHYVWLWPSYSTTWEGTENLSDGPVVYVCNHQSFADILVLYGTFSHFKWVSKAEIFKVPFIGWNMRLNRYVRLRRGDSESASQMMDDCRQHLREGSSVFLFPEGTRTKDGALRPFKRGAFQLATELGVPVVPIALNGTREVLPKQGFVIRNVKLNGKVHVLPAIHPDDCDSDVQQLQDRAQTAIQAALDDIRGPLVVADV